MGLVDEHEVEPAGLLAWTTPVATRLDAAETAYGSGMFVDSGTFAASGS